MLSRSTRQVMGGTQRPRYRLCNTARRLDSRGSVANGRTELSGPVGNPRAVALIHLRTGRQLESRHRRDLGIPTNADRPYEDPCPRRNPSAAAFEE